MDFMELVKTRRSIRAFEDRPVPARVIETLLTAARWAPSAGNLQPWHFYAVTDPALRRELSQRAYPEAWFGRAPAIIVVCAVAGESAARYGKRGSGLYCLQDTAAAVQNILLAAHSLGLGTCWVGAFDEAACADVLGMPEGRRPVAMIPLGYPAQQPTPRPRKAAADVVTWK